MFVLTCFRCRSRVTTSDPVLQQCSLCYCIHVDSIANSRRPIPAASDTGKWHAVTHFVGRTQQVHPSELRTATIICYKVPHGLVDLESLGF